MWFSLLFLFTFFFLICSHFLCPPSMFSLLVVTLLAPCFFFLFPWCSPHVDLLSLTFLLFVFILLFFCGAFLISIYFSFFVKKTLLFHLFISFCSTLLFFFFVSSLFLNFFLNQSCSFEEDKLTFFRKTTCSASKNLISEFLLFDILSKSSFIIFDVFSHIKKNTFSFWKNIKRFFTRKLLLQEKQFCPDHVLW